MPSLLTCLAIQNNKTQVVTFEQDGKFGWFSQMVDRPEHPPYLSHKAIFDTRKEAQENGDAVIKQIVDADLEPHKEKLQKKMGW